MCTTSPSNHLYILSNFIDTFICAVYNATGSDRGRARACILLQPIRNCKKVHIIFVSRRRRRRFHSRAIIQHFDCTFKSKQNGFFVRHSIYHPPWPLPITPVLHRYLERKKTKITLISMIVCVRPTTAAASATQRLTHINVSDSHNVPEYDIPIHPLYFETILFIVFALQYSLFQNHIHTHIVGTDARARVYMMICQWQYKYATSPLPPHQPSQPTQYIMAIIMII